VLLFVVEIWEAGLDREVDEKLKDYDVEATVWALRRSGQKSGDYPLRSQKRCRFA
jgi:hypothetical protein